MFPLNINCGSEISEAPSLTSVKVSSSSLKYVGHPAGWEAAAQPAGCSLRRWHLAVNNTISLDKTPRRRLFNLGRQTDSNSGWNQFQSSRRDFSFTGWSRLNFFHLYFPRRRNAFPQSAAGLIHVGVFLWCWLDWTGIRTGPGNSQKLFWRIFEFVFCFFLAIEKEHKASLTHKDVIPRLNRTVQYFCENLNLSGWGFLHTQREHPRLSMSHNRY